MERLNPKEIYEKCATSEAFVGYMQAKMEQTIEEIGKELERHMESFSCTPREMIMFLDEMNIGIKALMDKFASFHRIANTSVFRLDVQYKPVKIDWKKVKAQKQEEEKEKELNKRIMENIARYGGTPEFWRHRLTHGWDIIEMKLEMDPDLINKVKDALNGADPYKQ